MNSFLTKFVNGFKILFISYRLFFKRPRYLLFPFINVLLIVTLCSLTAFAIHLSVGLEAVSVFMEKFSEDSKQILTVGDYAALMSLFVSICIVFTYVFTLISVSISYFSMKILKDEDAAVFQAIGFGLKRSFKILKWATISAIVGIIIRALKDRKEGLGAKVLAYTGGLLWGIATFFIFPTIAFEDLSIFKSIKYSANLFKKTFGESAVAVFGFGLIEVLMLLILPVGTMVATIGLHDFLVPLFPKVNAQLAAVMFFSPTVFVTLFLLAMFSVVKTIFKTAIYAYCTNRPTGIFPAELIKASFEKTGS